MSALGSLVASLSLEFSSFRQGLTAAEQNATSASQVIQQRLDNLAVASERMGSRTAAAMERSAGAMESVSAVAGRLGGVLGSIVSAVSVSQLAAYSDTWANFNNRLKIVTSTQGEFNAAQANVLRIATATRQPLESTAELYQRIATNQAALGLTGAGVARVVETIGKTMVISGASTASADAALVQLGQAFASGTLRGEELNSVLEQAPALAKAIAEGMGVTVGALRDLGAAGKLSSAQVIDALNKQSAAVDRDFAKMGATIGQSGTLLRNAAVEWFGRLADTSGAASGAASAISALAENFGPLVAAGTAMAAVPLAAKLASMTKASWDANEAMVAQTKTSMLLAQQEKIRAETALFQASKEVAALAKATAGQAVQTSVLLAQGEARLKVTATTNLATEATSRYAAVSSLAGRALSLIGGPLGLITLALSAGAYAWAQWGGKADEQVSKVLAMKGGIDDLTASFDKLNRVQQDQTIKQKTAELAAAADAQKKAIAGLIYTSTYEQGDVAADQLDKLRASVAAVAASSTTTKQFSDGLYKAVDAFSSATNAGETYRAKLMEYVSKAIDAFNSSKMVTEQLGAMGKAMQDAAGSATTLANGMASPAWAKYLKDLTNARDEVGLSAQQLGEYKAALQGANAEQARVAGIITGQTDAYQDLQKAIAAKDKKGEEGARTSLDNFVKLEAAARSAIAYTQTMANLQARIALGLPYDAADQQANAAGDKASDAVYAAYQKRLADIAANTTVKVPKGAAKSAANEAATAAKQQLDQQVENVKNALAIETTAYDTADKKIQAAYARGDLSSRTYYDQKISLAEKSGSAQEAAIQKEIDILKAGDVAGKNHADTQKKVGDAEKNLAVARTKNGAELQSLRDDEIDYFRKNSGENIKALEDQTAAAIEQTKKLKEQGEEYGLTAKQVDALRLARIDERIVQQQSALDAAVTLQRSDDEIKAIKEKIAALQDLKAATAGQDAAQAIVDYQKKATEANVDISRTLTDALMRGFEDGKGFAENFRDTVKNMFATLILRPIIQPIAQGAANIITGLLGTGTDGGTGGGLLSGLTSLLGISGGGAPSGTGGGNLFGGLNSASTANTLFGIMKSGFGGISDTIAAAIGRVTGGISGDAAAAIANRLGGDQIGNMISMISGDAATAAGSVALDTAATAAATAAQAAAAAAASQTAATASTMLIEEGLGTAASAAASTAATVAAGQAASGLGAQLASKLVASWPVALAYAVWQNDKMYKDGVRYEDMDVTGVGSVVNAPMKFVDDTLNKIGLSGRVANLLSGLAISAMVWGKNGMFGGETRYGSGPYVGYSTGDVVQGEGGPSGGDPNLDSTKALVQKNYDNSRDLITALGGTADALYMFNDWELSPKKGNSFVRSVVRNDAGDGGPDFDNRIDLDTKDYADVMAAYMTEMKRSMLAAVATSNVSSVYKDYIANNGDLKTADDETLTALMAGIQKIQAFSVALKELPFANMRDLTLEAAMSLANFMGGLDKFQASMDSYFNNYYTDGERFNKMTTDMAREFANIGYDLPASKAAFRSMAESLDLSTKAGRDTYVALMNLQQGFSDYENTVADVANTVAQAAQQQQAAVDQMRQSLTSDVQEAYDRESSALTNAIRNLESFISTIDKFRKSLLLGSSTTLSLSGQYDEAKRQYEDTLAKANSGDTDAQAALQGAAQAFLDASKNRYASSDSYQRDFAMVQANLVLAQSSAEAQVTIAKQQLDLMKQQVDGILNVNKNLMSLAEALSAFGAALGGGTGNTYLANNPDVLAAYKADSGGLTAAQYAAMHYTAYGQGEGRGQAGANLSEADKYLLNNPDVLAAYKAGAGGGLSLEDWAQYHYDNYGEGEGRAFAKGGLASQGWNLVGEEGPELVNFGAPGRVYTADQTRGMLTPKLEDYGRGDDAILALGGHMKAVAAEVAQLRLEAQQHAEIAARTAIQAAQHVAGATEQGADKTTRALTGATQKRKMAKL